jgi:hypothetical protein
MTNVAPPPPPSSSIALAGGAICDTPLMIYPDVKSLTREKKNINEPVHGNNKTR